MNNIYQLNIFGICKLILELAKRDLKTRYLGSILGVVWGFIQPMITILLFWFVFQVGFKSRPVDNFPFVLWLMCGMIPWFFFSDAINNATNSIVESSYLVKKVSFRVGLLPLVKIVSALFIHLFFNFFLFFMFFVYNYDFNLYNIQIIYYLVANISLVIGLSFITASLMVFLKDIAQIVGMLLQFCFWLTPIFWTLDMIPKKYAILIKLNPVYYIVEGYRDSFIYKHWFWEKPNLALYYWGVSLLTFIIGIYLFSRLRPHFADVL